MQEPTILDQMYPKGGSDTHVPAVDLHFNHALEQRDFFLESL